MSQDECKLWTGKSLSQKLHIPKREINYTLNTMQHLLYHEESYWSLHPIIQSKDSIFQSDCTLYAMNLVDSLVHTSDSMKYVIRSHYDNHIVLHQQLQPLIQSCEKILNQLKLV